MLLNETSSVVMAIKGTSRANWEDAIATSQVRAERCDITAVRMAYGHQWFGECCLMKTIA